MQFRRQGPGKRPVHQPGKSRSGRNGCIYVLDTATNSIQQFVPTRFIHTVHEASALYADGRYDQSGTLWKTVLETDSSYALAHTGMAKALFKEATTLRPCRSMILPITG